MPLAKLRKIVSSDQRGFTLMTVLVAITIIGLSAGIAGSTWSSLVQRAKEEDLFWRGDQYRKAIESYYTRAHAGQQGLLPRELKDLLQDPRSLQPQRHIRQLYKDPMTGEDWELIKDKGGRIQGVKSTSDKEPFRQDGFPEGYESFAGAKSYKDWEFVFKPTSVAKPIPPSTKLPGTASRAKQ